MAIGPDGFNTPQVPSSLAIDTGQSAFIQALQFRTQNAQYSSNIQNMVASYAFGLYTTLDEIGVAAERSEELEAIGELVDMGSRIADRSGDIIDSMLNVVDRNLDQTYPDLDIQPAIDALLTELIAYLNDSSNIEYFRNELKEIISLALLDSSYKILASDELDISNIVDNFKTQAKSEAESREFILARENINDLVTRGVLNATIGADLLSRNKQKSDRTFLEIDARAEQLRVEQLNIRLQNRIAVMQNKVRAGGLIPDDLLRLNPQLFGILGDIFRQRFFDLDRFVSSFPGILQAAVQSMSAGAGRSAENRRLLVESEQRTADLSTNFIGLKIPLLQEVANSAAKLATFEAS